MSLELKAQILETITSSECGVRKVAQTLPCRTSSVISLLKKMEEERLIEFRRVTHSKRGRPKKIMMCTPLGFEFLENCKKARMKPLRARREDLERAVKDALYSERLVAMGHEAFKLFLELNKFVYNIKVASETVENSGRA